MTVSTVQPPVQYTGDGAHASYAVPFKFFANADLVVQVETMAGVISTLVLTTDYTLVGAGLPSGGTITLVAGNLTLGYILTITRDPSEVQTVSLPNGGQYYGSTIEAVLDQLTMMIQATRRIANNALQIPLSDYANGINTVLPVALLRAGGFLYFNDAGVPGVTGQPVTGPTYGTFTPVLSGQSTPGIQTYATQVGKYTKIGSIVFITVSIVLTAVDGMAAGNVVITGLPFTSANNGAASSMAVGSMGYITESGKIALNLPANSATISMLSATANIGQPMTTVPIAHIGATAVISFSGFYQV